MKKLEIFAIASVIFFIFSLFAASLYTMYYRQTCKYGVSNYNNSKCSTKQQYCRKECKGMLKDLNDTWGSNTNNADTISKSIMECYKDCIKND